jgi:phosphomannomutase / phosphoglucomutase
MNPEVFREYDVRGLVGKDLTPDFVYYLGKAIGTYAIAHGVKTMTIGRDCRLSSEEYTRCLGRGLVDTGINVIHIGLCATPMLYFSVRHMPSDGGVMVTGSHNPPEFNGFKICICFDTIFGEAIQDLRKIIEGGYYAAGKGSLVEESITGAYHDFLLGNVQIKPGLRLVIDGGNGVGGIFSIPLLEELGCKITSLYCDPDGRFPNHFPDPTVPQNLSELIDKVLLIHADAGIAFDGDADRIGVITDKGEILWGDELLLLFSRYILMERPGSVIIGEVKCSQRLYDDIEKHGGRPIMWKAGHSLIKGKMKEEKAVLAGEMSGHIFFADRYFGYDDAIYASLRLLEILSKTGKKLSELIADVPKTFSTPEIRVDCPDNIKFQVVQDATNYFSERYKTFNADGVRILLEDGWGLIRASNTQPVLVLRFEASTEYHLSDIRSMVEGRLAVIMKKYGR